MCTDTDTATDPDTETFILIGPCGDLCCTVRLAFVYLLLYVIFLSGLILWFLGNLWFDDLCEE